MENITTPDVTITTKCLHGSQTVMFTKYIMFHKISRYFVIILP